MRTIKFRVWDTSDLENHKMVYQGKENLLEFFRMNSAENVMQFTGLRDRNGNEIFEGDIIINMAGKIDLVIYSEEGACFCLLNQDIREGLEDHDYISIIGNAFENPDLVPKEELEI